MMPHSMVPNRLQLLRNSGAKPSFGHDMFHIGAHCLASVQKRQRNDKKQAIPPIRAGLPLNEAMRRSLLLNALLLQGEQ